MTEPTRAPDDAAAPAPRRAGGGDQQLLLARHFVEHHDRYTRQALARAAESAGYAREDIDAALERAELALEGRAPGSRYANTARAILLAAYALTFAVLIFATDMSEETYGVGPMILGVLLGLLALVGLVGIARRRVVSRDPVAALASMLAVPFILLVLVAGTCVWTVGPTFFPGPR